MANNTQISRILRRLREERKISQKNVALSLGVSQALLSHYEKGIRECGLNFLVRAAKYYGVTTDYLLGIADDNTGGASADCTGTGESKGKDKDRDMAIDIDIDKNDNENANINIDNKECTYNAYPILYKNLLARLINYIFDGFGGAENALPEQKYLVKASGEYMLLSVYSLYKYLSGGECPDRTSSEKIFSAQLKLADKIKSDIRQSKNLYGGNSAVSNDYIKFMIKNSENIIR